MKKKWSSADVPSLNGKLAIVTGANRGLGLDIAADLAAAGARVVLACRDPDKAQAAIGKIRERSPNPQVEAMKLDLSDLASVRRFAQEFSARHSRLDILVHNASAIMVPLGKTRDGFESHIGTNHFGPFALTGLLLDRLKATPGARVIGMSSMAHRLTPGMDFDDLHFAHKGYKEMDAYGKSKLATLLFIFELDRRLKKAGLPIVAAAAHPGWSNTNPDRGNVFMRITNAIFAQPAAMGALPALYAATAPDVIGGDYFGPGGIKELRGYPAKASYRPEARDPAHMTRLWELSEQVTGVRYLDG
jgi:NAD(P)-dependent dehydrogenase (short-subunit alcohol dehydrogenase family)